MCCCRCCSHSALHLEADSVCGYRSPLPPTYLLANQKAVFAGAAGTVRENEAPSATATTTTFCGSWAGRHATSTRRRSQQRSPASFAKCAKCSSSRYAISGAKHHSKQQTQTSYWPPGRSRTSGNGGRRRQKGPGRGGDEAFEFFLLQHTRKTRAPVEHTIAWGRRRWVCAATENHRRTFFAQGNVAF